MKKILIAALIVMAAILSLVSVGMTLERTGLIAQSNDQYDEKEPDNFDKDSDYNQDEYKDNPDNSGDDNKGYDSEGKEPAEK